MAPDPAPATFERLTDLPADCPTLIEGLPGLGLVASIAVDQLADQLDLVHHGSIQSGDFPPVSAFEGGRVRDTVRVYAGADPAVMTLQSDLPMPPSTFEPLSECVLSDLADEFERGIFLAGAPAESQASVGTVVGLATTDGLEAALTDAGIELAEGPGVVGGVTGALMQACYRGDVPAAMLVVQANPYIPDPGAAQSVIEDALEPLLGFDIDTTELGEQAEEIQQRKQQIARQLREQQQQAGAGAQQQAPAPSMYQ